MKSFGQALRSLQRRPSFAVVVILTLGLALGASTCVFSVLSHVLLYPISVTDPSSLVVLWETQLPAGNHIRVAPANYLDWRQRAKAFADIAAFARWQPLTRQDGTNETLQGASVTQNFFRVLGVSPVLGQTHLHTRGLGEDEVLVSYGFWQSRYGGDARILGQTLLLREMNGQERAYTIVGVMPRDFQFPWPLFSSRPDLWRLLPAERFEQDRKGRSLHVVARLAKGATLEAARSEMTVLARQLQLEHPATNRDSGVAVVPLHEEIVGQVRPSLWLLMAGVLLVQLIACANVANLFLSRMLDRLKEFAIRSALGAGRGQLLRPVFAEAFWLTLLGAGLAVLLATWVIEFIRAWGPQDIPRLDEIRLDGWTLAFTAVSTLLTGVAVCLVPGWYAAKVAPAALLAGAPWRDSGPLFSWQLRKALAVGQVALAMTLVIASGLLLRSFARLHGVARDSNMARVLAAELGLPGMLYPEFHQRRQFYKQLVENVHSLPGVSGAAAISGLPQQRVWPLAVSAGGETAQQPLAGQAEVRLVLGDCFRLLNMPLYRGRLFTPQDGELSSPRAAIVNRTFARNFWGEENALGKQIRIQFESQPYTIVGVVGDTHPFGWRTEAEPQIYITASDGFPGGMTLVVAAAGSDPRPLTESVRQAITAAGEGAIVFKFASFADLWFASFSHPQFRLFLFGAFTLLAFVLAVTGVYGVVSVFVAHRTRELGIRLALGATARQVVRKLVSDFSKLALVGAGLGLAGAVLLSRALKGMLFEISSYDPLTYLGAFLTLLAATLLACYVPARRILRLNPASLLRSE